jgi:predicted permease
MPAIAFLAGSTLLLLIVCHWYLLPALAVFQTASLHDKKRLAAYSLLLLVVILFCLGVMLLLALRIGKRLFPPPSGPPSKTEYPDAWVEAGKRLTDKFDDE